jgi:hypothetical protein
MILSDAPNCIITYDHHYDDHNSFIIQATDLSYLFSSLSGWRTCSRIWIRQPLTSQLSQTLEEPAGTNVTKLFLPIIYWWAKLLDCFTLASLSWAGVDLIKLFRRKFTHTFCKLDWFINAYNNCPSAVKRSSLQTRVSKLTPKKFYEIDSRGHIFSCEWPFYESAVRDLDP